MTRKIGVLSGAALLILWGLAGIDSVRAFTTSGTNAGGGSYCPGTDPGYMPPSLQYIRDRSVGFRVAQYQPPANVDPEQHYSPPPAYQRPVYGPSRFQGPPGQGYGPPPMGPYQNFGYRRFGPPAMGPGQNFGYRRFGPPRYGMRPRPQWGDPHLARLRQRLQQSMFALRSEMRGPNPDRARVISLVREINSLRSRLLERRVMNRLRQLRGRAPIQTGYAPPPRYLPGGGAAYEPAPRTQPYQPKAAAPPAPVRDKPGVKFPEPQRWW